MTSGLIVNPRSGKQQRQGRASLRGMLEGKPGVSVQDPRKLSADFRRPATSSPPPASPTCSSARATEPSRKSRPQLAERKPFTALPRLALLPHGTTNMTAADLGFRHKNLERRPAFILAPQAGDRQTRPTLRVANPQAMAMPRHGMFLGTGAVWKATNSVRTRSIATGLKGDFATFATLAAAIAKSLVTTADPDDPRRIDRPYADDDRQRQ